MKIWKKGAIIGGLWGLVSLFGIIGGMVEVSGKQQSVSGSWKVDAIIFFPGFLAWVLTKNLPGNVIGMMIIISSPLIIGGIIGGLIANYLVKKIY